MEWPLIGRDSTLLRLGRLLAQEDARGIEIVGEDGVGKSRLALELVGEASARGLATTWIVASRATSDIPFGAFVHLISLPTGATDERQLLAGLLAELTRQSGHAGRIVLAIDDAHLLDSHSAALVRGLVARSDAFVIITRRPGNQAAADLTELWKDGLLERVRVEPLSEEETGQLLEIALGGPVEPLTRSTLWHRSGGNPMFLRELVLGGLESRMLIRAGSGWRALDGLVPSERLSQLVEGRLGRLDAAERRVVEAIAVGGSVDLRMLERLDDPDGLERLDDRRLVEVDRSGNRQRVRLAHPIYADVVAAALPPTRARRIRRWLADMLEATGARRRDDLLRLALWRLDGGESMPATLALTAAGRALAAFDAPLAERLARAVLGEEPDNIAAQLALGRAMAAQQRIEDAERALARAASVAGTDADISAVALARADLLGFRAGRPAEASTILEAAAARVDDEDWRDEIDSLLVLFRTGAGDLLGVAAIGERLALRPTAGPRTVVHTLMYSSIANVMLGRFEDAETQVTRALGHAPRVREEVPLAQDILLINRAMAHAYVGQLSDSIALCEAGRRAAIESGAAEVAGMWAMILAEGQMLAGDIDGSLQTLLEALAVSRERDTFSIRGIQAGVAAVVASWLGRHEDARAFHQEIVDEHLVRDARSRIQFDRATTWTTWGREGPAAAALLAQAAGDRAASDTHLVWAAWSYHDAVRLGYPELVRDRLAGLARSVEGELVATMAQHAEALGEGDGKALDRVSVAFERMGNMLCAAESAAHAHDAHLRAGAPVPARMAAARASLISANLPGVATPPLATTTAVPLTPRELEIALLAAEGRSSSEIGHRLQISVRTVDNHLGAVYGKLGVAGRRELPSVLGMPIPGRVPEHEAG